MTTTLDVPRAIDGFEYVLFLKAKQTRAIAHCYTITTCQLKLLPGDIRHGI